MANRKDSKGHVLKEGESERKDGRYSYRYTGLNGKRKEVYAISLNDLRKKEKEILRNLELGIVDCKTTLNEYFDRYMETRTNLKDSSRFAYTSNYDRWVRNTWLGKKQVKEIKKSDVLLFYKEKKQTLSDASVQSFASLIVSSLELAVDDGIILRNPAAGCSKELRKSKPREALLDEDVDNFFEYAQSRSTGKEFLLLIFFLLETGLRISEALGLTWEDLDISNGLVKVEKQLVYLSGKKGKGFKITTPKSECAKRVVPMSKELVEAMRRHKEQTYFSSLSFDFEVDGYKGFVFHSKNGKPLLISAVNRYLADVVEQYNRCHDKPLPPISCHLFRHTFCTRMSRRRINPQVLQYIMGHSSYSMTEHIYISVDEKYVMDEFSRVIGQ